MNGHLRFILLKEQLLDALHQWLARQLPRPVILLATLHLWATVTTEERGDITLPEAISRWQKDQVK